MGGEGEFDVGGERRGTGTEEFKIPGLTPHHPTYGSAPPLVFLDTKVCARKCLAVRIFHSEDLACNPLERPLFITNFDSLNRFRLVVFRWWIGWSELATNDVVQHKAVEFTVFVQVKVPKKSFIKIVAARLSNDYRYVGTGHRIGLVAKKLFELLEREHFATQEVEPGVGKTELDEFVIQPAPPD